MAFAVKATAFDGDRETVGMSSHVDNVARNRWASAFNTAFRLQVGRAPGEFARTPSAPFS